MGAALMQWLDGWGSGGGPGKWVETLTMGAEALGKG